MSAMFSGRIIDLSSLPPSSKARIVDIVAGPGLRMRLLQMGLVPGTIIEVLDNRGGTVVVRVRGSELGLSRGIAKKVLVVLI